MPFNHLNPAVIKYCMAKPIRPIPKIEFKHTKNFDPIARDWRIVRSRYVLSHKNHAIGADPETIRNPAEFNHVFSFGQRVTQLHFSSTNAKIMLILLKNLPRFFAELKKRGFAGVYTDTPNTAIATQLHKQFPVHQTVLSRERTEEVRRNYGMEPAFPRKYDETEIPRAMILFSDIP